jgi:DNA polymerase-3 subunit gamma/tau
MHLAPDEYAGFTMTLLRWLAFAPIEAEAKPTLRAAALQATRPPRTEVPVSRPGSQQSAAPAAPQSATRGPQSDPRAQSANRDPQPDPPAQAGNRRSQSESPDWPTLVARLPLAGFTRELAIRSELVARDGDHFKLRVPLKTLADAGTVERLKNALSEHLGRPIRLSVEVGATDGPTAAGIEQQVRADKQKRAEEAIYADPVVRELIDNFGATVDPASIRPKE